MSDEILTPDMKQNVRIQYVRAETVSRLSKWPMVGFESAFAYLGEKKGLVKEIVDGAQSPLLQAVENAERFDKNFDRLPSGAVDTIVARIVSEKNFGTLGVDSLGNPLFHPWR
jgi:N-acetylmuramic acid 6-phosphate (MurNAc-6-P) etherase